ncbi:MAG: hypothetical protein ABGX47_23655 [Martelella sp.]
MAWRVAGFQRRSVPLTANADIENAWVVAIWHQAPPLAASSSSIDLTGGTKMTALGLGLSLMFGAKRRAWWASAAYFAVDAESGEALGPAAIMDFSGDRYAS